MAEFDHVLLKQKEKGPKNKKEKRCTLHNEEHSELLEAAVRRCSSK